MILSRIAIQIQMFVHIYQVLFVLLFCLFFPGAYSKRGTVEHPHLPCFLFFSFITQPQRFTTGARAPRLSQDAPNTPLPQ